MAIWKRRDPRNKFRGFLEHLDSNFYDSKQREIKKLKKTFYPYAEDLIKQFKEEKLVYEKNKRVILTLRGYKYLDYLRNLDLKNEILKYNREKILIEVLFMFSLVTAVIGGFSTNQWIRWAIWVISIIALIFLVIRFFSLKKFIKT